MTAKAAVLEVLAKEIQEIAKIEMAEYPSTSVKRPKTTEEYAQQDAMFEVIHKLEKISNAYECS